MHVDIGIPEIRSRGLVYPITWEATGVAGLFPRLDADLVLAASGPGKTRIGIEGTYEPPLGQIGRLIDRALLGRIADATVRDWVDRLATALGEDSAQRDDRLHSGAGSG